MVDVRPEPTRREELAAGLAAVHERIDKACAAVGRAREEVTLVVVTKTWPVADVRTLAELGVTDVGEARDQEASVKATQCTDLVRRGLRWHFVGQLQTNKARSVATYADVVHSVDRLSLVDALSAGAGRAGRTLACFAQVSLDPVPVGPGVDAADTHRPARAGVRPDEVGALADAVASAPGLDLAGVMAVAPRGEDAADAFAQLAAVSAAVRTRHPGAVAISAGMSADLEPAIGAGATHVRVGSAVLGARPATR